MIRGRTCEAGGLLVDARTRLPGDVCEYYRSATRVTVGCNRLRCRRCGAWVRSLPNWGLPDGGIAAKTLYEAADWAGLATPSRGARLYACTCAAWEAVVTNQIDNDHEAPSDPNVPWGCEGHPAPELPAQLGALRLADDADWDAVVDQILAGAAPRALSLPNGQREGPDVWLDWLYAWLAELPASDALSSAVAARLDDRDPLVVGRVLQFFQHFPLATGVDRVLVKAEADPGDVTVGYPTPEHPRAPTVWAVLLARAEAAPDDRVGRLLRAALVQPRTEGHEDVIHDALADHARAFDDVPLRQFLADHIVEIDAAAPGRWRAVMGVLADWFAKPETGHLIVVAGARLVRSGAVPAAALRDWVTGASRHHAWVDPAWVASLEAVMVG